jgi:hypothetical protein
MDVLMCEKIIDMRPEKSEEFEYKETLWLLHGRVLYDARLDYMENEIGFVILWCLIK